MDKTELALLNSAAKSRQKTAKKSKALPKGEGSAVVYLGHIPHGFYEDQMRGFFSQFGEIKRLRLSRSKKTGRSRGYAFVEFQSPEIATIVAETMDGYFLADSYLVCNVLPRAQVHDKLFDGADRAFRKVPWRTIAKQQANKGRTEEQKVKHARKLLGKAEAKKAKLAAAGIDYDFDGLSLDAQASVKSSSDSAAAAAGASSRGRKRARSEEDVEETAVPAAASASSEAVAAKTPAKTPAKKAAASAKKTPARTTGRKTKTRRTEEETSGTPAAAAAAATTPAAVTPAAVTPDGKLPDPSPPMTRSRRKTKAATSAKKTPSRK